jgi:hypothetical protein
MLLSPTESGVSLFKQSATQESSRLLMNVCVGGTSRIADRKAIVEWNWIDFNLFKPYRGDGHCVCENGGL